jgi:hypothetical protein
VRIDSCTFSDISACNDGLVICVVGSCSVYLLRTVYESISALYSSYALCFQDCVLVVSWGDHFLRAARGGFGTPGLPIRV